MAGNLYGQKDNSDEQNHETFCKPLFYIQLPALALAITLIMTCSNSYRSIQTNKQPQYDISHNSPEVNHEAIPENTDRFSYGSIDTLLNVK
jgi:hypothetical protein